MATGIIAKRRGRHRDYPAVVPVGRERISDRRALGPAARYSGFVFGHGPWPGELRDYRAGTHRADSFEQASRPAGGDRGSGGDRQVQNSQAAGGGEAREREAESFARVRHSGRSRAAGEFAEAAGVEGEALRRAADRYGRASAAGCFRTFSDAGARGGEAGSGFELRRRPASRVSRRRCRKKSASMVRRAKLAMRPRRN